jgi:hypothetical protein
LTKHKWYEAEQCADNQRTGDATDDKSHPPPKIV